MNRKSIISIPRLIQRKQEYLRKSEIDMLPRDKARGIYVLYKHTRKSDSYNVVYVGMSRSGIRGRLLKHRQFKGGLWTHASVFAVWPNISDQEIEELEGLFRVIYRYDSRANKLNKQNSYKPYRRLPDIIEEEV